MSAPHVAPAVFDTLSGEARADAVAHVAGCPACRARLVAESPESLFALLALETESPATLDEVSAAVSRTLDASRPSWIDALRERGLSRAAGRLVAAAAVAACAFVLWRAPGPSAPPLSPDVPERAGVTLVEPAPAAQVIDLSVGGTQVVMIFDPELKL